MVVIVRIIMAVINVMVIGSLWSSWSSLWSGHPGHTSRQHRQIWHQNLIFQVTCVGQLLQFLRCFTSEWPTSTHCQLEDQDGITFFLFLFLTPITFKTPAAERNVLYFVSFSCGLHWVTDWSTWGRDDNAEWCQCIARAFGDFSPSQRQRQR